MNRFVIAEPGKCIGCRTCEIACALAHPDGSDAPLSPENFTPRLTVVRTSTVTTPVLCRQCDDAPCVKACPSGAVQQCGDSVQVDQSRCVGCKTCVVACPFGAMNVVTRSLPVQPGRVYASTRQQAQAVKCDLCTNRPTGPACIPACPTKALHLVDRNALDATLRRRQLQAALDLNTPVQF